MSASLAEAPAQHRRGPSVGRGCALAADLSQYPLRCRHRRRDVERWRRWAYKPERWWQFQGHRRKLRHSLRQVAPRSRSLHRAPFSLSSAVQNLGRDWIIGKIAIGVIYDSDLTLAKTLIRQIGLDLSAPLILEPPKMQGVDPLGDFVVRIRSSS
ncbi:MAG: mechanosensitive ion channel family protein [Alphaproteobacteria bacterium]|nr:mechanosensitive ion channel family protein [Alphaproteobacteria bacterium]